MTAKIRRGDKEWDVIITEGGFLDKHHGISGVRSDTALEANDILIDDKEQERRIVSVTPSDPGWYTVQWRTF